MAFAESIVDLSQHGAQSAVTIVAIPETDRVEDKAKQARKSLQPDLAVGRQTKLTQLRTHPLFQVAAVAWPVIARAQRHETTPIDAKPEISGLRQSPQIQAQTKHRIHEAVLRRAQTLVHDLAAYQISRWQQAHGATLAHAGATPKSAATHSADFRPSS